MPNTQEDELRAKIIHALGMCKFNCDGKNHEARFSDGDEKEVDDVMAVIRRYAAKERQTLTQKIMDMHHNSETRTPELECSQEGYEYGLEDALSLLVPDVPNALYEANRDRIKQLKKGIGDEQTRK